MATLTLQIAKRARTGLKGAAFWQPAYRKLAQSGAFLKRRPFLSSWMIYFAKGYVGDMLVQRLTGDDSINHQRALAFAFFTGTYVGLFTVPVFQNIILARMFGELHTARCVGSKIIAGLCFHGPLVYFPTYLAFRSYVLQGSIWPGLEEYKTTWFHWFGVELSFWVPVNGIAFLLPPHWRASFQASISVLWSMRLSKLAPLEATEEGAAIPVEEASQQLAGWKDALSETAGGLFGQAQTTGMQLAQIASQTAPALHPATTLSTPNL